jgi:hypothetical protein
VREELTLVTLYIQFGPSELHNSLDHCLAITDHPKHYDHIIYKGPSHTPYVSAMHYSFKLRRKWKPLNHEEGRLFPKYVSCVKGISENLAILRVCYQRMINVTLYFKDVFRVRSLIFSTPFFLVQILRVIRRYRSCEI